MAYSDLVSRADFDMKRESPFSYACHACNRCCPNKAIRFSPHEILRLEFIAGTITAGAGPDSTGAVMRCAAASDGVAGLAGMAGTAAVMAAGGGHGGGGGGHGGGHH